MKPSIVEVDALIKKLNVEYSDKTADYDGGIEFYPFSLESDGDYTNVSYMGIGIWNDSDGDGRNVIVDEYDNVLQDDDGEDVREDLEMFLRREAQTINDQLRLVKWHDRQESGSTVVCPSCGGEDLYLVTGESSRTKLGKCEECDGTGKVKAEGDSK